MYSIKTSNNGKVYSVTFNGRVVYYTGSLNRALHLINKGVKV